MEGGGSGACGLDDGRRIGDDIVVRGQSAGGDGGVGNEAGNEGGRGRRRRREEREY